MSHVRDEHFRARQQPQQQQRRATERGGSRFNFLLTIVIIAVVGYAGYQYVPVAYQASQLKVFMKDTVDNAVVTDKNAAWAEDQLRRNLKNYDAPENALITLAAREGHLEAHVQYSIPVPLLVTTYEYKFDHTARSAGVLTGVR